MEEENLKGPICVPSVCTYSPLVCRSVGVRLLVIIVLFLEVLVSVHRSNFNSSVRRGHRQV